VVSCVGDHFLQEFKTIQYIWPDSEPAKLLYHPKQKPRRGWGLRQINTCRKVPLQVNSFEITTFGIAFFKPNLSTALPFDHSPVKVERGDR
jgi:hypothetical protein